MKLSCPECDQHIASDHINIDALVAKCATCDAVFSFADTLGTVPAPSQSSLEPAHDEMEFDVPAGLSAHENDGTLTISRKWFSWSAIPLLGFATIWDAFLVGWYGMVSSMSGPMEWLFLLFPLIHVGVGIGITYTAFAKLINRTDIEVDPKRVTVKNGPLKWRGNKEVYSTAIHQVYVHETGRLGNDQNPSKLYEVHAILKGGGSVRLVKGLTSQFQALYIEQEIERYLGITPQPVKGEYSPAPHEVLVGRKRREGGSLSIAQGEGGTLSLSEDDEGESVVHVSETES